MRKLLILLLIGATSTAFGQGKTLISVSLVTPKQGMTSSFETAWKNHLNLYHNKEGDKRTVYQIVSGPRDGSYLLTEGPMSFSDIDIEKTNDKAHGLDLEKNVTPKEGPNDNGSEMYRWVDTLSLKGDVQAEKFLVTISHIKNGRMADWMRETKRGVLINSQVFPDASYNNYVQLFAGSHPTIVNVRNLKNGFKELDNNYFPMVAPNAFREAYVKEYGQADWDIRQKNTVDDLESREVYIMKLRKDLSSK